VSLTREAAIRFLSGYKNFKKRNRYKKMKQAQTRQTPTGCVSWEGFGPRLINVSRTRRLKSSLVWRENPSLKVQMFSCMLNIRHSRPDPVFSIDTL
jgi:hypothetical protein